MQQKIKLLIADDEKIIRESIAQYMDWDSIHAEVTTVLGNGRQVLEYLQSHSVDVLITDIRMPGLDGIHLVQKIEEAALPVRVILITAYSDFEYAREALRHQIVDDYILKPIQPDVLLQSVEKSIQKLQKNAESLESFYLEQEERHHFANSVLMRARNSFLANIECGDTLFAEEQIREIEQYIIEQNLSLNFYKRYSMDLCHSLRNKFQTIQHNIDPILSDKAFPREISKCDSIPEITAYWLPVIAALCDYIRHCQTNKLTPVICRALELTEEHYLEPDFNLLSLSDMLSISPNHLSSKFKKETGMSFTTLLQNMRLEKIKDLLDDSDQKIHEIAEQVGIGDVRYLTQLFKTYTGKTPKEYRETRREN